MKFWQITDNYKTEEPYFLETGMAIPSALPAKAQSDLVTMAGSVLKNLGVTDACIHFEAKSTKHGPVPIEVNLRMGGDEIYSSINRAWKVDFIEYSAKIALHEHFPVIEKPVKPEVYIAGRTLSPKISGTVTHFEGPENFVPEDQIDQFQFFKTVGDKVLTPPAAYEFLGWVTVKGRSAAESHTNLAKVLKKIRYEIKPR
jgi:biotin carboxylase